MQALWEDDPASLGPFRLLGRLGSGGMGVVYLGEATDGSKVAVKVVHVELTGDRAFRARFTREIAVARQAVGPWTARVVDADPEGPRPWLATEYVEGPTLEDKVTHDGPLAVDVVVTLAARLSEALAALHASGVVHRDLKPSNVLLAAYGPRLIDFGIARALDATKITHTGHAIGTPAFMSPEQAAGEDADAPSDVFSLASVLVFAATGSGPFGTAANPVAMLRRISQQEPSTDGSPQNLRPHLAACLARDPAARPTAQQLAERLQAAQPTNITQRPATSLLTDSVQSPAPTQRTSLLRGNRSLQWLLAGSASLALVLVVLLVVFTNPPPPTGPLISAAGGAAQTTPTRPPITEVAQIPLGGPLISLVVTPDGAHVLAKDSDGDGIRIVDTATRTASDLIPIDGPAAVTPDSSHAYYAGRDAIYVLDIAAARITEQLPISGFASGIALSPDGRTGFISFFDRPEIAAIELATGRVTGTVTPPGTGQIELAPDGTTLYVFNGHDNATGLNPVIAIDTTTLTIKASILVEASWIGFRPDSNDVVLTNLANFTVVNGRTHLPVKTTSLPKSNTKHVAVLTPDGNYLAIGDLDGSIRLVDCTTAQEATGLTIQGMVEDLAFSPDGRSLYAATSTGTLATIDTSGIVR